jgi:glycosyltransferase involved in cell wall biosynthesis
MSLVSYNSNINKNDNCEVITIEQKSIILMFVYSPFPFGVAASNRLLALSKSIQEAGYKVIILSNGKERECDFNPEKKKYYFDNIEYRNYTFESNNKLSRIMNRTNLYSNLKRLLSDEEIRKIKFIYTTHKNYNFMTYLNIKMFIKKPVIVDVTEWHNSFQFKNGYFNMKYLVHSINIRWIIPKAKNIICISTYIKRFYDKKKCNTILIPPQIDSNKYIDNKKLLLEPIKFFYAGSIGQKDDIKIVLKALTLLSSKELSNIHFTIAGIDSDSLVGLDDWTKSTVKKLLPNLSILGYIPKNDVEKLLSESHFLVLMRPIARYSMAGFPSKVPESLAAGVPVITNRTSDLSLYLNDGENSFFVDDFTAESLADTIRRTLFVKHDDFSRMSDSAKKCAFNTFDYQNYVDKISAYLK